MRKTEKEKGILKPLQINETLEKYLLAFNQYYFLTAEQLTRLFYRPSMYADVMKRLKPMVEKKYLQTIHLPTVDGKAPYIYTLAHKGVKYLRDDLGQEVEVLYRPSNIAELNHSWLKHLLELNDFLICAKQVEKGESGFKLHRMWHDLAMKRNPIKAPVSLMAITEAEKKSKRVKDVVFDGGLIFRKDPGEGKKLLQFAMLLEHDRGTEGSKTIKDKVRAIVAAILSGAVKAYFGVQIENICFITSAGVDRVETLRKWTLEALASLHVKPAIRDLFVFSCFPYAIDQKTNKIILHELNYEEVFFQPVWRMALKEIEPIALIELD